MRLPRSAAHANDEILAPYEQKPAHRNTVMHPDKLNLVSEAPERNNSTTASSVSKKNAAVKF